MSVFKGFAVAIGVAGALSIASVALAQPIPAQPQPAAPVVPSVTVDPDQASATPHWTISLSAPYCGGYQVGDGVYISPEAPLALPTSLPSDSALFAGQPAAIDEVNGALRVSLAPGSAQSMICTQGDRPLSVELLPSAGFALPDAPGDYALDVWTGARPTPMVVTVTVSASDPSA